MRRLGEVVGRGAMPEVDVGDDGEPFEFFEVAVDGGDVAVGASACTSAARSQRGGAG